MGGNISGTSGNAISLLCEPRISPLTGEEHMSKSKMHKNNSITRIKSYKIYTKSVVRQLFSQGE